MTYFSSAVEEGHDFFSSDNDSNATKTSIIGLSSGLIAAAAASCLSPGSPCIPIALEAVRIAFKLGLYVSEVASRLEPAAEDSRGWSVVLPELSASEVQSVLDHFQTETVTSERSFTRRT